MFVEKALLQLAIAAAVEASREVMEVYGRDFSVEEKQDSSPLTEADTRSHQAIENRLSRAPGALPVLSEEGAQIPHGERSNWARFWMVDPLDGTKEFIKKNGEFTVNIALMERDAEGGATPVAGVVYAPYLRELFVGEAGIGAFRLRREPKDEVPDLGELVAAGERLPAPEGDRPYTIVASRSHLSPETQAFIDERREEHPDLETISAGSSLKICRVAEGVADEYPRFAPTMEWDTAAGDAVARAAGCQVIAWDSEAGESGPLRYNKADLHNPWFLVRR
jgi:3'(2'), 5'-bisphosphate nucleotidase